MLYVRLADRSQSKGGLYRPWFAPSGLAVIVLSVLLFTTLPGVRPTAQYLFSFFIYFLYVLGFTALETPHVSMMSTITTNYKARGALAAWRQTNAAVVTAVVSAVFLPMVIRFGKGNNNVGYFQSVLILMAISLLFTFIGSKGVTERIVPPAEESRATLRDSFQCLNGNTPALMLMLAHLTWGASAGLSTAGMYFWTYIAGDTNLFTVNNTLRAAGGIFAGIVFGVLINRVGNKRNIGLVSWAFAAIFYFGLFFVPVITPGGRTVFNVLSFLQGTTGMIGFITLFSLVPDVTEYTMAKYGLRASGFLFAVINFSFKFGLAMTQGLFSYVLGVMHYIPGATQTPGILGFIRLCVSIVPGCLTVVGAIAYSFYRLTGETHDRDRGTDLLSQL